MAIFLSLDLENKRTQRTQRTHDPLVSLTWVTEVEEHGSSDAKRLPITVVVKVTVTVTVAQVRSATTLLSSSTSPVSSQRYCRAKPS